MKRPILAATGILIGMGVLAGCGTTTPEIPTDADLAVYALDSLRFDADEYSVPSGTVTIAYANRGSINHTLLVRDLDDQQIGDKLSIGGGGLDTGTYELDAGTYTLFCDIPGHSNMTATLTVTS